MEVPEFLREEDFRAADIDVQVDSSVAELVKTWNPKGSIHVGHAVVMTPKFPLRNSLDGLDASTTYIVLDPPTFPVTTTNEISGAQIPAARFYRLKIVEPAD